MAETPLRAPWGVAALLLATADALAARFGAVAVRGELSGLARAASGHVYFSLKDADGAPALLRCAMFRRAATLLDFAPADGQQVELRGRLGVYEARGELQMVVESMRRVGEGALFEEFLRRRARLAAEGLFDEARKRPLPAHPRVLGVITSLAAAALRDVLAALQRRAPQVRVVIYPAPVQGADAPAALVSALAAAAVRAEVDVLLLVRGGGSLEDLWAFNDERLVRAIAASPLPVVCGVGHESDVTLADLVADLRAPTPTAAAELAAPALAGLQTQLEGRAERALRARDRHLQQQGQRLDTLAVRLGTPARALAAQRHSLQARALRLNRAPLLTLQQHREALRRRGDQAVRALRERLATEPLRLAATAARLQAQDPARVLKRGYAWVQTLDGRPVVSVAGLRAGQAVRATWADGMAEAELLRIEALPPPR
ncbi:MAG: exodeoxyribonuclease VII large subunit [Ideonella sp. WA131b]|jgi:exodeoxyribonuclease VII large subunit|nr:exodeoxyribonuclease VII large subunit [Ideonella sp. WA131b]